MPSQFTIENTKDLLVCIRSIRLFALDFGMSNFDSTLLSNAASEAGANAIRYANGANITVNYTQNLKGIEAHVKDNGNGIDDLAKCMKDGYSSQRDSLGLGFGAMKRSVDNLYIKSNDQNGTYIILTKYINNPPYQCAEICKSKVGEDFNGDGSIIKHYDGDNTLLAVLDGAGCGFKAYQSIELVKQFILQNYRLDLDAIIHQAHRLLQHSEYTRSVELALLRITPQGIEYLILGNAFIKSFPYLTFVPQQGSLGIVIPEILRVNKHILEDEFCIMLCTDGIDRIFNLYNSYSEFTALEAATLIFNSYNVDDDSTIIVTKKAG